MRDWLYLFGAILSEVAGTTALRLTDGFHKPIPSLIVVVGYGASFFLLSQILKSFPVGLAYAIWSGVGIVLIGIIGWKWFGQALDKPAIFGMALILIGILIINLFSKSTP